MMGKKRSDGEGSLHQIHATGCDKPLDHNANPKCRCKWRAVLVVGQRPDPKRPGKTLPVRKTVTRRTRAGAATSLRELHEKHTANTLPRGKIPTLAQWLNHCHATILPRQKRQLRERTLIGYRQVFDQYLIPTMGHLRLDQITADDIEGVWHLLAETGNPTLANPTPLTGTTINKAHTILARMLRLAMQKRIIHTNPASADSMDAPSPTTAEVEPLDTADWRKVLATAHGWNATRWTVALAIGLRQGEALALRWRDVDLEEGTLSVRQTVYRLPGKGQVFGPPKTDRSRRDIPIPVELVTDLRRHRREQNEARLAAGDAWADHDLVFPTRFGTPIDDSRDRKAWKTLLDQAGVPHVKLHGARHTAATIMLLRGIDARVVMDIMGWSQISTAANYQHAVSEAKRAAAVSIGEAIWG